MAQTFNTKLSTVAYNYIKQLNAKVTKTSLLRDIEENPYYPSLLSLGDTLNKYNITNDAYNVPVESFDELTAPFVALASIPATGNDFVLVTAITNKQVSYLYDKDKPQTVDKTEFLTRFKNIVLYAEPNETSGERDYAGMLKKERALKNQKALWGIAAVIIVLFAIGINITMANAVAYTTITLIKSIGLVSAVLLLIYEIDKSNAFVKNICSAGAKTNCDAVLASKASKIGGISWAEIGFFYFAATTIGLLMPGLPFAYKISLLAIANAFAAPYMVFSIYYQWRVVKQWCPFCLTIQTTLAAELIWSTGYFWMRGHPFSSVASGGATLLAGAGVAILLPVVIWYGLKPVFTRARDYSLYLKAYKRLQYNPDIFNNLLTQQPRAADGWHKLGVTIGNPNAANTIIKVCNPYCGPCAKAHPQLEEVIKQNDNINLKIIFTSRNNEHDAGAIVVRHLLDIAAKDDGTKIQRAFDDWYLADKKDYETFAAKYPMNGELKQQDAKIEAMSEWCNEAEITHTPTIFVNGYRLPENYNVEELKYIL